MLPHVEKHLDKEIYSRGDICQALGISDDDLRKYSLNNNTQESRPIFLAQCKGTRVGELIQSSNSSLNNAQGMSSQSRSGKCHTLGSQLNSS